MMLLSCTDEILVNEVAKAILIHGLYRICQKWRTNASQPPVGGNSNTTNDNLIHTDWTLYYSQNIPYNEVSTMHLGIMNEIRRRRLSGLVNTNDSPSDDVVAYPSDNDILRLAYTKVEHPHITIPDEFHRLVELFSVHPTAIVRVDPTGKDTQRTNTSISLFSLQTTSSSTTSMMNSFMTLDLIKERADNNLPNMIVMFQNVTYLEDLIPDIDDICELLRTELTAQMISNNSDASDNATLTCHQTNSSKSLAQSVIDLHRLWFHRTRKGVLHAATSHDYRTIQTALAYSLMLVVQSVDSQRQRHASEIINLDLYQSCVTVLLDMFADWMDRNIYKHSDATMKKIGTALWEWSTNVTTKVTSDMVYQRQRMMYQYCPMGQWMCQYLTQQYFTKSELMALLSQVPCNTTNTLLLELYNVARTLILDTKSLTIILDRNDDFGTYVWILSLFRSILLATRVSYFPWNLLLPNTISATAEANDNDTITLHKNKAIQLLFRLYFPLLILLTNDSLNGTIEFLSMHVDTVANLCIDSIEILISGTQHQKQLSVHTSMIQEIKTLTLSKTTVDVNHHEHSNATRVVTLIQRLLQRLYVSGIITKERK